jgi:hypothetical protein
MVLMLVSAAIFAQCLAVFSTLVAEKFTALRLLNLRSVSLQKYCRWRAVSEKTTSMLAKFVRERTPERNPDLQLILPANPRPPDLAEYERKIFNALNPLVRKDLRVTLFAGHVERAQVFSWLAPFKRAVKDTVEAAKFEVFAPGTLLFEVNEKTKHVLLVTAGQVSIEYEDDEELDSSMQFSAQKARASLLATDAIKELLHTTDPESPTCIDATGPMNSNEAQPNRFALTSVTEHESLDVTDLSTRSAAPEVQAAGEDSNEYSWQFASKVLERIDAQLDLDFSSDEHNILDSNMMPVEEAPCVFGEKSLWYVNMTHEFSARSVNYAELLRIPTSTLMQIARSDPRVKMRYDVFRKAAQEFESVEVAAGAA